MKTNKKAVLGMVLAIVVSLGTMMGTQQSRKNDISLQQVSLTCASIVDNHEGGGGYAVAAGIFSVAAGDFLYCSISTGVVTPVGMANLLLGGICTL